MRKLAFTFFSLPVVPLFVWACSGSTASSPADAGAVEAGNESATGDDTGVVPVPDAAKVSCTLSNMADPVALCTQKIVLSAERRTAFDMNVGIAARWDSQTGAVETDDAGATLHDFHDDVAFAASIANYHVASGYYGDNEITPDLDNVLVATAKVIEKELATPPAEYDGALYARLRLVGSGLRYINENAEAAKIDAIADLYGRAIFDGYTHTLAGSDVVIGTPAGAGQFAYEPAKAATAALALIDMSWRHATDDAGSSAQWQVAATAALDHLYDRARDPGTLLYYRSLVTSADPGHDALVAVDALPSDTFLTEVQANVMLSLMRAREVVLANSGSDGGGALVAIAGYPFLAHGNAVFEAMNGAVMLWDTRGRGYFEGFVPSTSTYLPNKPTVANGLMFAAVRRKFVDGLPPDAGALSPEVVQVNGLRQLLIARMADNTSLFTVVRNQNAFVRASTSDYMLALMPLLPTPATDGGDGGDAGTNVAGDGGVEPHASSYSASATAAALEGLNEQLYAFNVNH